MSVRYLLSCPGCQKQVPVEAGRAGGSITCECGQTIEVPTMRALRELPQEAPPKTASSGGIPAAEGASQWGPKQGLLLLGFLLLLAGGLPFGYLWATYPEPPYRDQAELENIADLQFDQMTVSQSWQLWKNLIEDYGLTTKPTLYEAQYELEAAQQNQWLMIFGFVAACGLIVLLTGLIIRS